MAARDRVVARASGTERGIGSCASCIVALLAVAPWFALLAQGAAATPLTLISDQRYVRAFVDQCYEGGCFSSVSTPSPPFSAFSATAGGLATQGTWVSESAMGGSLGTSIPTGYFAVSSFYIEFNADVAASYTFTATGSRAGDSSVFAYLTDLTAGSTLFDFFDPGASSTSGALTAGHQYGIGVYGGSGLYAGSTTWNFDFAVTAVPEPSSFAMVAFGLLGLGVLRARQSTTCRARRTTRVATADGL